ncbi:hypothetical protein QQP08_013267, partial [Theobroma cacao]
SYFLSFHIWKGSCSERCIIIAFEGYITIKARIFSWTISPSKLEYSLRNSKRKLGYNTVESSSYIQNVEQDCRNSQRRNIVSFEIDHRDDDNFFEQELSLASDASQMLPILNDEDDISTFNQQTAHIGT